MGVPLDFLLSGFGDEFLDSCGDLVLADEEVHRITNAYAVSFLQVFLKRAWRYGQFLSAGYAESFEPNVELFLKHRPRRNLEPRRPRFLEPLRAAAARR